MITVYEQPYHFTFSPPVAAACLVSVRLCACCDLKKKKKGEKLTREEGVRHHRLSLSL